MMKMLILFTVLAYALAEPPVGDSYASARSGHGKSFGHQRSLSTEYGTPNFASRSLATTANNFHSGLSSTYNAPRSGLSQQYGAPGLRSGLSQDYGVPSSRSLSQNYGAPAARSGISQGFGSARLSQEYGAPQQRNSFNNQRNVLSDSYGTPLQRSSPGLYNTPEFRSAPSTEYGVPSQRSFGSSHQHSGAGFRSGANSISQGYSTPAGFGSFGKSSFTGKSALSQTYGTPRSSSLSSAGSYSGAGVSETYGVPNARSLSSEYGVPGNAHTFASSSASARSSLSQNYGAPKRAMPSEQYGAPGLYSSNQGYGYGRNAADEQSQEPASYDFGYKVNDYATGSDFGHTEWRQENKAEGSYFVVLPDGSKQVVEYEADEAGFRPKISVEPASSGYNYTPAESRSGGPY